MKRLLVILLISLLPPQVFAGVLTHKTDIAPAALVWSAQVSLAEAASNSPAADAQSALPDQLERGDEDDTAHTDSEDFSSHAGVDDETVLNPALIFVVDAITLAPTLHSDDARQPPFLPPAGRPPRPAPFLLFAALSMVRS